MAESISQDDDDAYDNLVASTKVSPLLSGAKFYVPSQAKCKQQSLIHKPVEILSSPTARKAYLTTLLFTTSALILLAFATIAYALFYWTYIPRIGFERTIHLQFDDVYRNSNINHDAQFVSSAGPYGTVILTPDLASLQGYDVLVELSLPRTTENENAGNFMVEAVMYAAGTVIDPLKDRLVPGAVEADSRLAVARRPAILAYRSRVVEYLWTLTQLHWYLLGWRREAEVMRVPLFESVEFSRGWRNLPSTMRVQVQSSSRMQIYSAKAVFRARFRGLRWIMYNHRIISAVVAVSTFWATEMVFAGLAWLVISSYMDSSADMPGKPVRSKVMDGEDHIKSESDPDIKAELSSTERTFPTTSSQQPLHYSTPRIKQEEGVDGEEEAVLFPLQAGRATEADDEDEDEDADVFIDSGIGTSMESNVEQRNRIRKRRNKV